MQRYGASCDGSNVVQPVLDMHLPTECFQNSDGRG